MTGHVLADISDALPLIARVVLVVLGLAGIAVFVIWLFEQGGR